MLSIEEIKLLIEKLEKVKSVDLQKLIDSNLKILKDLEDAVDANNLEDAQTKANNMVSENEPYETNWKVYSVEEIK